MGNGKIKGLWIEEFDNVEYFYGRNARMNEDEEEIRWGLIYNSFQR